MKVAVPESASANPLSAGQFAILARQCASTIPENILAGVAHVESGFDPLVLHDNTTGVVYHPVDAAIAVSKAADLVALGDSVDIGLMQINSKNLSALNLTKQEALNPCGSLAAGASVLQAAYGVGKIDDSQMAELLMALSRYNTGSPFRGIMSGYAQAAVNAIASSSSPASNISGVGSIAAGADTPPGWDITATGSYAQAHGAQWLIPLMSTAPPQLGTSGEVSK